MSALAVATPRESPTREEGGLAPTDLLTWPFCLPELHFSPPAPVWEPARAVDPAD